MSIKSQPDPTCLNHTDAERIACPVCRVAALTVERDQLRADCDNESEWASHFLRQAYIFLARAEKAEVVLSDPQQLHAHCLRNLNEGQIAHLFGERMTEIVNRAERAEAELDGIRALADRRNKRYLVEDTTDQALDIARADLATERARLDWMLQWDVTFHDRDAIDKEMKRQAIAKK